MVIHTEQDLTLFNSYRIKSFCKRAFFPENKEDFISIYRDYPAEKKILLGGGYNVILSKKYYQEDFILIGETFAKHEIIDDTLLVGEAGVDLKSLSRFAQQNGLAGLEMFYDIPSSLGGAVVMNAGASGVEMKDVFIKALYLDLQDFVLKEIFCEDVGFEYRNSFFQRNTDKLVLKVWLNLSKGDKEEIYKRMEEIKMKRWSKQPKEYPNAGSVFKRPKGFYVGTMIEELGLKGLGVGGAKVSEKHAGFIVNYNNASGEDILSLIKIIQEKVYQKYKVRLEVEQRIV